MFSLEKAFIFMFTLGPNVLTCVLELISDLYTTNNSVFMFIGNNSKKKHLLWVTPKSILIFADLNTHLASFFSPHLFVVF